MELAKRKDVPIELTWDLSAIFPTEEAFAAALEETKSLASQLE
ncbi:MAG: oligoendopeptidase F family protein, partial [Acutalibacter sp.]|nr:oligoendopeptidase F family protein [Acutalibacter sp.]